MQPMDSQTLGQKTWQLLRIALPLAAVVILFLSGLFPLENFLSQVPSTQLTASIVPAKVAELTNEARGDKGLAPLTVNPLLTQAAQLKAEDMAENSYYAHVSPDGKTPLYWLNKVGYKYLNAGENLVIDRNTSEEAVDAWLNSKDHRDNIFRAQFTEIGIGVAEGTYKGTRTIYVVQEFGTPYPLSATKAPTPKPVVKAPEQTPKPKLAVAATTTPAVVKTPTPILTVNTLPKTSIVTSVNTLTAPVIRAIAPTKFQPIATTTAVATTTASSTLIASSSISYALAPEFFASITIPVAIDSLETAPREMETANPMARMARQIKAYVQVISRYIPSFGE